MFSVVCLTLAAFDLKIEVFIATSAVIDLAIDASRAVVYASNGYVHKHDLYLIPILLVVSILGTFIGKKILDHVSQEKFKMIVLVMIFFTGVFGVFAPYGRIAFARAWGHTPWRIQFAQTVGGARGEPVRPGRGAFALGEFDSPLRGVYALLHPRRFFVSLRMDSVAYDRLFENVDFSEQSLQIGEYEVCTFVNCNFMGVDMCGIQLTECVFFGCDLSNAQIATTAFRDACFKDCKMVGMQFKLHTDFLFSVSFEGCNLHLSSFYRMSLKKMKFKNCILREVDFTSADLTESSFDGCDLLGAVFSDSNLEKVDFRKSNFYSIDLEQNRVKKAKFSLHGLPGLLGKYNIEIED